MPPSNAHTATATPATPAPWVARLRQRAFRTEPADHGAVTLRHERIYILPTRRGAMFLGTLAMMLLTALNYALSLGFVVVFLLAGLAATALLHTFRNLMGVEIRPLAAGEAFAGGALPFGLTVASGAVPREALRIAPASGTAIVVQVPAYSTVPITLDVPAPGRGRIALGRITVSADFPLGLWRAWAYVHFPLAGIAYPLPEPAAPPLPVGAGSDDDGGPTRRGESDLAGLRDYQVGDPLQRVAWKAVARGVGWHTKQFEGGGATGPALLDWDQLPRSLGTEQKLARVAAWVLAAERAGTPYALSIPGHRLAVGLGHEQRRSALTALALFREAPC
jgi:uncharacterized protein (DUF58 family)